jgi:phage gpG-like protein
MRRIGQYGVAQAQYRLTRVLKPDAEVRTGSLANSLTVFEVSDHHVVMGSNLVYAAQVHHGGTIFPGPGRKALAIPVLASLQRQQLGPLDIDPNREHLQFIPFRSSKPNVVGGLFNPDAELTGRQRKKRGRLSGYPPGLLFVLATSVTQKARPFLYFDDDDKRLIREELFAQWIRGE